MQSYDESLKFAILKEYDFSYEALLTLIKYLLIGLVYLICLISSIFLRSLA